MRFDAENALQELKAVWRLAWPAIISNLIQRSFGLISVIVVGHTGTEALAVTALGFLWVNVTGVSVAIGMCSALDTLGSQAYGAQQLKLVGLLSQRAAAIMLTICFPIAALWLNSERLLIALGQSPQLAHEAGEFLVYMIPGLPPTVLHEVTKKYLQTQGITSPMLWTSLCTLPVVLAANVYFVHTLEWGSTGAAVASTIGTWTVFMFLLGYIRYTHIYKSTWPSVSLDIFRDWPIFLRVGIPGLAMLLCEWWAYEVLALMAGMLGTVSLATNTVMFTTLAMAFMVPLGVGVATCTRVGNALGAREPSRAAFSASIGLCLGWCCATLLAAFLLAAYRVWGAMFTADERVVSLSMPLIPLVAVIHFLDETQCICAGAIRGCGLQRLGAVLNLVGYYGIGLPLGACLTFVLNWGVLGLWGGLLIGLFVVCMLYLYVVAGMDWESASKRAVERINAQTDDGKHTGGHVYRRLEMIEEEHPVQRLVVDTDDEALELQVLRRFDSAEDVVDSRNAHS